MNQLSEHVLQSAIATFKAQKKLAEAGIRQVSDDQLHVSLDEHTNSIAVIMKHVAGNMLSRWTELLASDGEKPWRDRDGEFIDDMATREAIMAYWNRGWDCLFAALGDLQPEDLLKHVTIRGHDHTVIEAIHRQIDHYGYHVGQIVQLARVLAEDSWQTLSIPRGGSEAYNQRTWKK